MRTSDVSALMDARLAGSGALAAAVAIAQEVVQATAALWRARYGEAVCDIHCEPSPGPSGHPGVELRGSVLLPSQRDALAANLRTALPNGTSIDCRGVVALTERLDSLAWLLPADGLVDVLAAPAGHSPFKRMPEPESLASQVTASDPPLRLLVTRGNWGAVELADGTVGWVRLEMTVEAGKSHSTAGSLDEPCQPPSVAAWRAGYRGAFVPASGAAWRAASQSWLGAPYLWGGTTRAGVDCSGLTQRLYREVCGLGLPKHSASQVAAGRRVARSAIAVGDLLYLTRLDGGVKHVAAVVDDSPCTVVHASRDRGVGFEALGELLKRYQFRAAARFGDPTTSARS